MSEWNGTAAIAAVDAHFVKAPHLAAVAERMRQERVRLADPKHLVANVIGDTEFAWDFDPIGPGFLALCGKYLEEPTGAGALFLALLERFGLADSPARHALVIVEYAHMATRIDDTFNYADEFAERVPDQASAERLVQLRYGAQWLNNYPRYLVVSNAIEASDAVRIGIHRWGHHSYTATGISRALFVKRAQQGFVGLTEDAWLESSVGLLCQLVISPAVMAATLAARPDSEIRAIKAAFSQLAVATKLRLERQSLARSGELALPPERDAEIPFHFPGTLVVSRKLGFEVAATSDPALVGTRFARVKAAAAYVSQQAREMATTNDRDALRRLELEHATRFRDSVRALASPIADVADPLFSGFERE